LERRSKLPVFTVVKSDKMERQFFSSKRTQGVHCSSPIGRRGLVDFASSGFFLLMAESGNKERIFFSSTLTSGVQSSCPIRRHGFLIFLSSGSFLLLAESGKQPYISIGPRGFLPSPAVVSHWIPLCCRFQLLT